MEETRKLEQAARETPLGWKVNLLNILSASLVCLADNIDIDLHRIKNPDGSTCSFKQKKKKDYNQMCEYMQEAVKQFHINVSKAAEKYNELNIEGQVWDIVKANTARYDNFTADAKELLQAMMLYVDRAHTDSGFYSIFRHMRSLPEGNIFPEDEIARFTFKRPLTPCAGATVKCQYGEGVIRDQMNGDNWLIDFANGTQKVLTSKQFAVAV